MGQRLNIEIRENGELLANSYFHWSAYTSSAIELTKEALSVYDSIITNNPIQKAVWMLEETGAGIQEEELHEVVLKNDRLLNQLRFSKTSTDRDQGFIHVIDDDMYRARDWDEGRVIIDIGDDTICFDTQTLDAIVIDYFKSSGEQDAFATYQEMGRLVDQPVPTHVENLLNCWNTLRALCTTARR